MAFACHENWLCCLVGRSYRYLVLAEFLFLFLLLFISLPLETNSLSFEFASFNQTNPGVDFQLDAYVSDSQIQLTKNRRIGDSVQQSYGRALYPEAIQLWVASPKRVTDFTSNFTFTIARKPHGIYSVEGLTFLLVPENTQIPSGSAGGCLALIGGCEGQNQTVVAIEFDTNQDPWDPPSDHVGIDVHSIISATNVSVPSGLTNKTTQAFVSYDSATHNLSVFLSTTEDLGSYSFSLSYTIDLSIVLPERVQVGFSASTSYYTDPQLYQIHAWSFHSNLGEIVAPSPARTTAPRPAPIRQQGGTQGSQSKRKGRLVGAGIGVGIFLVLIVGIAIVWFILRKSRGEEADQFDIDEDLDEGTGPKRFAYSELCQATNNFAIEGKLGEGGFGDVYKGLLTGPGTREVAVKKIKSGSKQGKKEYISEVRIISRLRHRNLVQLLGWYHGRRELLLVYEFMPNRSLDYHLFGCRLALLAWPTRYKIALGLASALLYLHEEWEQSVVHRDIKSSNVMLDLNFNPKLGDFGLARLVDHDAGLQTTTVAGTPGYLAPECPLTGKASKESDVYSFGIVALEIACGRRVIELEEQANRVKLVEWVWDLYGKGLILEAVDSRLEGEFDEEQAKCLIVVGLWCSHPDASHRPSIKQAIAALNLETHLPMLPPQLPVPVYVSPGMNMPLLSSNASSSMAEGNYSHTSSGNL